MLPKLTPLQWLIALFLFVFYGFAVFALTRDYYLRHPPRPAVAAAVPAAADRQALGARMRDALGADDDVAAAIVESGDPAALGAEADRLFRARRFGAAVPLYQRLVELTPDNVEVRNDLGLALHYAGESAAGLAALREGADLAPEHQRIRLSLGFVALQAGDTAAAELALGRARDLDPESEVGEEAARLLGLLAEQAAGGESR
jgi:Flp pilus assembly protein TadD